MSAKILIVDDEVTIAESMRDVLAELGYVITGTAGTAEAALAAVANERPDLVLMDINLGNDREGIAAAETIRTRHALPVVYVTALVDAATLTLAKITHPFGYVTKPFELRELRVAIEIALHNHALEKRLKASEQVLGESERRLRAILDNIADQIWLKDREGRLLAVNRAWCDYFGMEESRVVGRTGAELFSAAVSRQFDEADRVVLASHQSLHLEEQVPGHNQTTLWFETHKAPLLNERREAVGTVGIARDITHRKRVEAALAEQAETYRALLSTTLDGVVETDENATILDTNLAYRQMTGYTRAELVGMNMANLEANEAADEVARHTRQLKRDGGARFESRHRVKDGRLIDVEVSVTYIPARGRFVAFFRDITARKQADVAIQNLLGESERARAALVSSLEEQRATEASRAVLSRTIERKNRELENLVYVTSHDLRSPMLNIQGFSQRIGDFCAELSRLLGAEPWSAADRASLVTITTKELPKALAHVLTSVEKMDRLIGGLLRLSRIGRAGLKHESLDLNAVLREIVSTLMFSIQAAGAVVEVGALPPCHGDAGQVNQLFSNLLDNALKYRDPARPLRVMISGREEGRRAVYCVADTGVGIEAKNLDRIWEIFFRANPGAPTGGEGLGLNLVHRIVERQQGEIWVESTVGEGSRFFVALPLAAENDAAPEANDAAPAEKG
jgi:PAS domain S-box-containing protein